MTDIHGDFSTAVKVMSKILNVRGTVLPTANDISNFKCGSINWRNNKGGSHL